MLARFAVAALFVTAAAHAADMTVFGLTLGAEFTVLECPRDSPDRYSTNRPGLCFERSPARERGPLTDAAVFVQFPPSEAPALSRDSYVGGRVIDDRLEEVVFNTRGISAIERVMDALRKKYGQPTTFRPVTVQNRMGVQFESVEAAWSLPELEINYVGARGSPDRGWVLISTKKGVAERRKRLDRMPPDKRPL